MFGGVKVKEYLCESFEEYVRIINENSPQFSLSRGQMEDKPLLPSVLRLDNSGMRLYSDSKANIFIDDFKNNSLQYIGEQGVNLKNHYEWLVYAQHFGVPTRLLDFTYSHLISLMFAVEKAFGENVDDTDETNSVVWLLDPKKLNEYSIGYQDILNLSEDTEKLSSMKYPCAVTSRKINPRMIAQNGLFVLFNEDSMPLEKIDIAEDILRKILIPHKRIKRILASLYIMGMRFNDLYPELTSISKDILLKNNVYEFYEMEEENE